MHYIKIVNKTNNFHVETTSKYCNTFLCKLFGLMFKKSIAPNDGITFVNPKESFLDSSIHMLFMRFDITVVWINSEFKVVDKTKARKWRLIYSPKVKAKYTLETHIAIYEEFSVGDQLVFEKIIDN